MDEIIEIILEAYNEEIREKEEVLRHELYLIRLKVEDFSICEIEEDLKDSMVTITSIKTLYDLKKFVDKKNSIDDIERSYKCVNHKISLEDRKKIEEFIKIQEQLKNF